MQCPNNTCPGLVSSYNTTNTIHRLGGICEPTDAGIKEKFSIQKLGVPMKQLHSYDSGGPYAGFKGAVNFYQEIDRLVNSKVWSYMKAPWQESLELSATYVWE